MALVAEVGRDLGSLDSHPRALCTPLPGLMELRKGARPSSMQLTCAGHSSEDPALAVLDFLEAVVLPAPQDVHAADPEHGADAVRVVVVPASQQHTLVIIAVDLQPAGHQGDQVWGEGGGCARLSTRSAHSKRQGREFQDEGTAGAKVPRCDRLCGTAEMVGAGSQGAGKRKGRQEVERGQALRAMLEM